MAYLTLSTLRVSQFIIRLRNKFRAKAYVQVLYMNLYNLKMYLFQHGKIQANLTALNFVKRSFCPIVSCFRIEAVEARPRTRPMWGQRQSISKTKRVVIDQI